MNNHDWNMIHGLMKEAAAHAREYREMVTTEIDSYYNLDPDTIEKTLSTLEEEDIVSLGNNGGIRDLITDSQFEYFVDNEIIDGETDAELNESLASVLIKIKKDLNEVKSFESEVDNLEKESHELIEDQFKYINSEEYKEKRRNRIAKMRVEAANEPNAWKKNQMLKMLKSMDDTDTMNFLFERVNTLGDKEIDSIKNTFFDYRRSRYIIERYNSKCKSYGYNPDLYKLFFNLEQNFLGEEYYPYNNLFLFIVMRYVAYTDASDKNDAILVSALLKNVYNLVYHRFETADDENRFITIIKTMIDKFFRYKEYFEKYNKTSPNHPVRIQMENDYEQKKRMMLIKALEDANVDFDSSVETAELERIFSELQKGENNNSDNKDDEMSDQEKLFNIANESISENLDNDKDAVDDGNNALS